MKRKPRSKARHLFEYALALPFFLVVPLLPRRVVQILGRGLGWLGYRLIARRRKVGLANLELAYGAAMTPAGRERLIREVFDHFATAALEFAWASRLDARTISRLVDIDEESQARLQGAVDKGRGVLLLAFHMGNWELVSLLHGFRGGAQMHGVARRLDNPYLDRRVNALRGRSGTKVIYKDHAGGAILRALRNNEIVGIGMDQSTSRGRIWVEFFGRPATTNKAIATFALATGAPILAMVCLPGPDGRYHVSYSPEIEFAPTGNREEDILALSQRCTEVIEEWVRRTPQYWLWLHQRWKHQPAGHGGLE